MDSVLKKTALLKVSFLDFLELFLVRLPFCLHASNENTHLNAQIIVLAV